MKTTPLNINPQLRNHIKMALLIQRDESGPYQFTMIPRQFPCLIITTEKTESLTVANASLTLQMNPCNIYFGGIGDVICNFTMPAKMEMILIHLHPSSTGLFWGDDAVHFANDPISISHASAGLKSLNDKINNTATIFAKWNLLQQFILQKTTRKHPYNLIYATQAIQLIQESCGLYNVKSLAADSCTCQRNLQQSFTQHVGISPKRLSAMVRFNALLREVANSTDRESLMEKAVRYFYYDLSHVYKDFHRYLGKVPRLFNEQEQQINELV